MRAMILAAGRGERMGSLTANAPKPLLYVAGKYLIEYAIFSLVKAGIKEIVINVSYQAEQIKTALGDGKRYGVTIFYSEEKERLETGGGIFHALPLLGEEPFIVLSSDIITDYPLHQLPQQPEGLAHLVMVDNPPYHPEGDFGLREGRLVMNVQPTFTFGNISIFRPEFFKNCEPGHFRLTTLLIPAVLANQITGEHYRGAWYNVGTPSDLQEVNLRAREDSNLRPLASETNTLSN